MMQQQEMEASSDHHKVSPSPSFSSYSSETLAEIAARVIEELRRDPHSVTDDDHNALFPPWETENDNMSSQNDTESEFEFEFVTRDMASPVSADDIFYNGQIKAMYPIFGVVKNTVTPPDEAPTRRRLPLRKLMLEDGETASCSSSTDDSVDLDVAAEGAYCVWTPNSVGRERKKSNSTGSASKRWKLRNLLLRSHSDKQHEKGMETEHNKNNSFLPYNPQLLRLFTNVNALPPNFRPF